MPFSSAIDISVDVREITDDEIAFYYEHGWVKLESFIAPKLIEDALVDAKILMQEIDQKIEDLKQNSSTVVEKGEFTTEEYYAAWHKLAVVIKHIRRRPFQVLSMHKGLGRAAMRLIDRASLTDKVIPIRLAEDDLITKPALGSEYSADTPYHQDWPLADLDRMSTAVFWIAFDEVTPEQGSMRFLDRSHREGPLGPTNFGPEDRLLDRYPKLTEKYQWTPQLHYRQGDVSVHHPFVVHGAPGNVTTKMRWGYACSYMPEDCLPNPTNTLGMPAPHERFPVVYP